jgi:DNA-binding response OmpR family regulator
MTVTSPTRVLVLDDSRVIADTICIIANQHGYECRSAYTHSSAVSIAREFLPNIFLTGFNNLCEKNGCETALEVLTFLPQCRVIISSGSAASAAEINVYCRRYGFAFLAKGVHPHVLLDALRSHGAGS